MPTSITWPCVIYSNLAEDSYSTVPFLQKFISRVYFLLEKSYCVTLQHRYQLFDCLKHDYYTHMSLNNKLRTSIPPGSFQASVFYNVSLGRTSVTRRWPVVLPERCRMRVRSDSFPTFKHRLEPNGRIWEVTKTNQVIISSLKNNLMKINHVHHNCENTLHFL